MGWVCRAIRTVAVRMFQEKHYAVMYLFAKCEHHEYSSLVEPAQVKSIRQQTVRHLLTFNYNKND